MIYQTVMNYGSIAIGGHEFVLATFTDRFKANYLAEIILPSICTDPEISFYVVERVVDSDIEDQTFIESLKKMVG